MCQGWGVDHPALSGQRKMPKTPHYLGYSEVMAVHHECIVRCFKKSLFLILMKQITFSHNTIQYKIGTKKNFEKKLHLGVAPAISINYWSLKKKFFLTFKFFHLKKSEKKSLIPMVYNNMGQTFLEMGQKCQNMLFLA